MSAGGQLVDQVWQGLCEELRHLFRADAGRLRDFRDLAVSDGRIDLLGGDRMILPRADPGLGSWALTGFAELIQQTVESAGDEGSRRCARGRAAELAVGQI